MSTFNSFSRNGNVNTINLKKKITNVEINKFERKFNTQFKIQHSILERENALRSLQKYERIYP